MLTGAHHAQRASAVPSLSHPVPSHMAGSTIVPGSGSSRHYVRVAAMLAKTTDRLTRQTSRESRTVVTGIMKQFSAVHSAPASCQDHWAVFLTAHVCSVHSAHEPASATHHYHRGEIQARGSQDCRRSQTFAYLRRLCRLAGPYGLRTIGRRRTGSGVLLDAF